MHAFDYVMALAAVIVGLALTHMLVGVTRMVEGNARSRLYWVHLLWLRRGGRPAIRRRREGSRLCPVPAAAPDLFSDGRFA